jgi:hypothetical protein
MRCRQSEESPSSGCCQSECSSLSPEISEIRFGGITNFRKCPTALNSLAALLTDLFLVDELLKMQRHEAELIAVPFGC